MLKVNGFWRGKEKSLQLFWGEDIFYHSAQERRHQYWKTSNKKYFGIYLFFLIFLHAFRDFLNFRSSLLCVFWFLVSPSQLSRGSSLDKTITLAGYWISFINYQQEIFALVFTAWAWQESGRKAVPLLWGHSDLYFSWSRAYKLLYYVRVSGGRSGCQRRPFGDIGSDDIGTVLLSHFSS